ncbi:MAG: diguanylate cyclase [Planctomycetota bacterium]
MPKLVVVLRPGAEPMEVPLGRNAITLGREPENDLQLEGLEVSRRHCRIEPLPGGKGYRIVDLNSKNGTFLNGLQVTAMALDFEDQVRVGDSLLVYVEDDATLEDALAGVDQGTAWLPARGEEPGSAPLVEDPEREELDEEHSTWRSSASRRAEIRGPHTRSSNRSYLKERLLRLGLLTQNIASAPDLQRLMDTILDEVLDFTGFERGLLLLGDEEGRPNRLNPVRGRYMDHEHLDDHERRFSRGLVEEALRERKITFRSGLASTDSSFSMRESVISMGLESALCIPLLTPRRFSPRGPRGDERRKRRKRSRVFGAIYLDSTHEIRPLDKPDLKLLEAVAAQAAIALQNARLHHQASTDPLTGLHNRAYLRQVFEDELRQAEENGEPLGVLLVDLDHFKKINDTHGHDVGDEVLKRVSSRIRRALRRDDYAARWGGEEFLILLPGSDVEGAVVAAEKVAEAIKGTPIGEVGLTVTCSLGLSCYPRHADTSALLIKRADQALYEAKRTGRDRVVVFEDYLDKIGSRQTPYESLFEEDSASTQRNLKAIFDTIDLLRSELPPREVLKRMLDQVVDLTRARRALLIVNGADDELQVTVARSAGNRTLRQGVGEFSRSAVRTAIDEQRSLCSLSADEDKLTSSSIDRLGLNTVMCVPIVVSGQVFGALYADDTVANREFGQRELAHLEMIAHQLGLSLAANLRLYQAATGANSDTPQDETARLRDEVARLRMELESVREVTRKMKRIRKPSSSSED